MTDHFFYHSIVNLHYYRFGTGPKIMLCFHGLGMHGKQFRVLEEELGDEYTFLGFDLFFHKDTTLVDNSLSSIKKGIQQRVLAELFSDFCDQHQIKRFSVIAYSMGTFYAAALISFMSQRIEEAFFIAPSFLKTPRVLDFLANNRPANYLFEKLLLSENGLKTLLKLCLKTHIVDQNNYEILYREIATAKLRFDFYANVTFLKHMNVDYDLLASAINSGNIPCYFIFGKRDKSIPPANASKLLPRLATAKMVVIDQGHDLVTGSLTKNTLFCVHDD